MRMWMCEPHLMCRQHLLGEHNEIHKHRHNFVKKHKMGGRAGQIEPRSMKVRHDDLVKEMENRGYQHKSPYEMPDISYLGDFPDVDVKESCGELITRCNNCRGIYERLKR